MQKDLLQVFNIIHMNKASLTLMDKNTGEHVFIHRRVFNQLSIAEHWRVVDRKINGRSSKWVEVLIWVAI